MRMSIAMRTGNTFNIDTYILTDVDPLVTTA
jgi:hypothetical protein